MGKGVRHVVFFSLIFPALCHGETPPDRFHFGKLWKHLGEFQQEEKLFAAIAERRAEIKSLKEHWKGRLAAEKLGPNAAFYRDIEETLQTGSLIRMEQGAGSAYLLCDEMGMPRFIVKPVDEEILCLNNEKAYGNPLNKFRARPAIPLYHSAQTSAVVYESAKLLGLSSITPKSVIDVISSDIFYDISAPACGAEPVAKEKLCSVQEYIRGSEEFPTWYRTWLEKGLSHEQIGCFMDQEDFENIQILIWLMYDNDAHPANIRVLKQGEQSVHLVKIDNALSFPEKNIGLLNPLSLFPRSREKLSNKGKAAIAALPISELVDLLHHYEMDYAAAAFLERATVLQNLAKQDLSLDEINEGMKRGCG